MPLPLRHLIALATLAGALVAPTLAVAPAQAAVDTSTGVRCTVVGTSGADVLVGTSRRDVMCGRGGNDVIRGAGGNDLIDAGAGPDRIAGGPGSDSLIGGDGSDTLSGGDGSDAVRGGSGRDRIAGGDGTDRIAGGDDDDTLAGEGGGDTVDGGRGEDIIGGGGSGDTLTGGGGDDELTSGPGTDTVDGGPGDNLCVVDAADESIRCRYDEQPPVAAQTTVDPGSVDVTHADARVTVRVHATDDTGVRNVQGYLAEGNNGVALSVDGFELVSGTDRDGWWEGAATIPRWTPQVTLHPDVWVTDRQGRSINTDGQGATLQVVDADPDTEVPRLTLTKVTPTAVDVRTQARNVSVTLRAVDAKSGVARLDVCLSRPGTPTKYNPHPLYQEVACADPTRVSGTVRDGTWAATVTIPKGSVGATYNVVVYTEDRVGNDASWNGPDAYQQWADGRWCCTPAYQFPDDAGRVQVTGTVADAVPAWIDAVTVSKTELDTLASADRTRVRVHALDAEGEGEGVTVVEAMLVSDGSWTSDPQFDRTTLELVSGTVTDGWWEGDVVAPQGTPPGTYHLLIGVGDRAHGTMYTDPSGPGADGVTYQPLEGIPTLTVVDSRP
ncbi:MAG: calcium-binding protein [Nocardioidaceae bacterium]